MGVEKWKSPGIAMLFPGFSVARLKEAETFMRQKDGPYRAAVVNIADALERMGRKPKK